MKKKTNIYISLAVILPLSNRDFEFSDDVKFVVDFFRISICAYGLLDNR